MISQYIWYNEILFLLDILCLGLKIFEGKHTQLGGAAIPASHILTFRSIQLKHNLFRFGLEYIAYIHTLVYILILLSKHTSLSYLLAGATYSFFAKRDGYAAQYLLENDTLKFQNIQMLESQ